jgi:hypothetical protein
MRWGILSLGGWCPRAGVTVAGACFGRCFWVTHWWLVAGGLGRVSFTIRIGVLVRFRI